MRSENQSKMLSAIHLRRAMACDIAAIAAIEQECFDSNGDSFSQRQISYLVCKAQGSCLVASDATNRVVGYIALLTRRNAGNVRIYSIAVAPAARGLGAGQALLTAAIAFARSRGFCEITLEVRTDNDSAQALYTKNGFIANKLLPGYYHDGADAQRMTRRL